MKIRTDFVTNSSSSSFTLVISFNLVDGKEISFRGHGGTGETGRVDYFDSNALVTVSPKQLGEAKTVEEMIKLLTNGVIDDAWDGERKIFEKSELLKSDCSSRKYDAYDFVKKIKENISDMDQIKSVSIVGNEENYVSYNRKYTYNRLTKKYTGVVAGGEFECDGSSGGDLRFKNN